MVQKNIKKYVWMPLAFLCIGLAVYIYYGITWNAWMKNLPNIIIYVVIVAALTVALKKKDELRQKYHGSEMNN